MPPSEEDIGAMERLRLYPEPFGAPSTAPPNGPALALRNNKGKPPIHLVAPSALLALAEVSAVGADEYGPRNWERGFLYSTIYSSMMRHMLAWWQGEDIDPKSGKPHSFHALWNLHAIVEHERRIEEGTLPATLDDRPRYTKETK